MECNWIVSEDFVKMIEDKPTMNARLMYLIMKQYEFYNVPYRWKEDSDG